MVAPPAWLPALVSLQRLSLSSNPWTALPDLSTFGSEDCLWRALTSFPVAAGALVQLRWLDISSCKLTALPESLKTLVHLQVLEVFANQLTNLPDWISALKALTELRVQRNKITSLPDAVQKLEGLSELDVSHNALKTLPHWVAESTALIECHNNPYDTIPKEIVLAGSQSIRQYVREKLV